MTMTRQVTLADNTVGREEIDAVTAVLTGRWLSAGQVTRQFEEEFAAAAGVTDAVAVSSGTAALHLAVLALGLAPGDEVVVPSLSFVASAAVVALHGGVPVFADIRGEHDLSVDPDDVLRLVGDRTRAIVVMHYGGAPAAVREVVAFARSRGIAVVEDAAHAPLVHLDGRVLGTFGDVGCFSFFATKNVTSGEGGMVLAHDPAVLARVRAMRSHCVSRPTWERHRSGTSGYDVDGIGLNYRPSEVSSAIGRVQLGRLGEDRRLRRLLVARYRERLAGVPGVVVPAAPAEDSAHHLATVLLPAGTARDELQERLHDNGVQTSVHYPPTHLLSCYRTSLARRRAAVADRERLPVVEGLADRLLSLPLHARMTTDDVDHVVDSLAASLDRGTG